MQTYGMRVGITLGSLPSGTYLYWPCFGADNKILPKDIRSPYRDSMSKTKTRVFTRIRTFPQEQIYRFATETALIEGYLPCTISGAAYGVGLVGKHGNVFDTTTLRKNGIYTQFMISLKEYRITPRIDKLGVPYIEYTTRMGGYSNQYMSGSIPKTDAELQRLRSQYLSQAYMSLLGNQTWATSRNTTSQAGYAGTQVYGDYTSPYATTMLQLAMWYSEFGEFPNSRWGSAVQTAYVQAATSLPEVNSNAMANIIELAGVVSALLRKDFGQATSKLSDAWLGYRYAYTTTLLDVREYSAYVSRLQDLAQPDVRDVRSHGYFSEDGWSFHVVIKVSAASMLPDTIQETLNAFGLKLSAVNAWDMVPYSFIVDWFIPVADALDQWENHFSSRDLHVLEAWVSITSPGGECYLRAPVKWGNWSPILASHSTSTKTLFMRIADAISLLR